MTRTADVIGTPISPYVRKVLAVCALKGIEVAIDPIPPFFGNDEFSRLSPLRRIPVFRDDKVTLTDSSVICQYLEDRYPEPAAYPADIALRARARWLEEFADSRMGDVVIWRLFNAALIGPAVFGRPRDKEAIAKVIATDLADVLNYLEAEAPAEGYFCGTLSIADLSIVVFLANMSWSRVELDDRWPKLKAWGARLRTSEPFASLERIGGTLLRTPIPDLRKAAAELGLKLTPETVFTPAPRLGPMTVLA